MNPGTYAYTVNCFNGLNSVQSNGTVTVIPSIEAIAPDFSIEQNSELNDQIFVNNGVTCSEGCELEIDYSEVDISNPGIYIYTVNCNSPRVRDLVSSVGHITVYAVESTITLECPENNSVIHIKSPCNTLHTTFEYSIDELSYPTECIFHIYRSGEEYYSTTQTNIFPFVYKFTQEGEYTWMIEYADASGNYIPSEIWRFTVQKSVLNTTTYVCNDYEDLNNYTYNNIEDAITHVESEGTVKVAIGTYSGPIWIYKPIKLCGQGQDSTIQAVSGIDDVICIVSNGVDVQNFTISGGIYGITILNSSICNIRDNYISRCRQGILIRDGDCIEINHNNMYQNFIGIDIQGSSNCNLIHNFMDMSGYGTLGIYLSNDINTYVDGNTIRNSVDGICFGPNCDGNIITSKNNFIEISSCDIYFVCSDECDNTTLPCRCRDRRTDDPSLICKSCSTR